MKIGKDNEANIEIDKKQMVRYKLDGKTWLFCGETISKMFESVIAVSMVPANSGNPFQLLIYEI